MKRQTERKAAMSLRLSADEMATLDRMADERGLPKVALIRQWIRDTAAAQKPPPGLPFDPAKFLEEFRRVLKPKQRHGDE